MSAQQRDIPLGVALIPVVFLVVALSVTIGGLGQEAHIPLLCAAAVAAGVAAFYGYTWKAILDGMVHGINLAMGAILILMVIGTMIGTWILGGVVPSMIYYGLQVLSPGIFLAATMVICSIVALGTGSSWSTAGTVGVALMGVGSALGIPGAMTAGAIVSGAYFGDKMSPLSDTTNLAPAMAGTDVFSHVRHKSSPQPRHSQSHWPCSDCSGSALQEAISTLSRSPRCCRECRGASPSTWGSCCPPAWSSSWW